MSNEINELKNEIESIREQFRQFALIHQYIGGETRAMQTAVLALIASHPRPDLLAPVLNEYLARLDAQVISLAETEEHVSGVQAAHSVLIAALNNASKYPGN